MQQITVNIANDYMQDFIILLETLPADKVYIESKNEKEEIQLANILQKKHKQDFVSKKDIFKELTE